MLLCTLIILWDHNQTTFRIQNGGFWHCTHSSGDDYDVTLTNIYIINSRKKHKAMNGIPISYSLGFVEWCLWESQKDLSLNRIWLLHKGIRIPNRALALVKVACENPKRNYPEVAFYVTHCNIISNRNWLFGDNSLIFLYLMLYIYIYA